MGKQLPLFGSSSDGDEKGSHPPRYFRAGPPVPPDAHHDWRRVDLVLAHRVEWVCDKCGTRAAPDTAGRMYFLRSPTDCEGKA